MKSDLLAVVLSLVIAGPPLAPGAGAEEDAPPPVPSRLAELLRDDEAAGYAQALAAREFSFPDDHGPHPEYRNEWWYVTGNLDGPRGERFGFELTIFRFALTPGTATALHSQASAWRSRQVYIGHFAVTDADEGRFYVAERQARGALGLAGAAAEPLEVRVEDWWLKAFPAGNEAAWLLHAVDPEMEVTLTLTRRKEPVPNGIGGLSQKSAEPGNATYYYSIPRLQATGTLRVGANIYDVSGLAWLDREWGSSALSKDQQGWDWFAVQLEDGSELMFYQLRRNDGTVDQHSAGTWIPIAGDSVHLTDADVAVEVRDYWENPQGDRYPSAWTLSVPSLDLRLAIDPVMDAQELVTGVRYWEGAVDARGRRNGQAVAGRGYVELTGYANGE
jgi:predicted secreted hydrolase